MSVLYFLVVLGLLAGGVLAAVRRLAPAAAREELDARLVAAAERATVDELAAWDAAARAQQPIGTTNTHAAAPPLSVSRVVVFVTRLSTRVYSLAADATALDGKGARRVQLLVRVPLLLPAVRGAIVSAGDVVIGSGTWIIADTTGCEAAPPAAVILAPGARLVLGDDGSPTAAPPNVEESAFAGDSLSYARAAGELWDDLVRHADIHLASSVHAAPAPVVEDGRCVAGTANWGEPRRARGGTPCENYTPLVHAPGDLTIDGGRGQGLLIVDGRLRMAGPFLFSGQIVARGGIESLSDGIEISGIVMSAARGSVRDAAHGGDAPVSLRHGSVLRFSVCDAQHGVASWLRPRIVRERAWAEPF